MKNTIKLVVKIIVKKISLLRNLILPVMVACLTDLI